MTLNQVTLIGNLTRDPELRFTPGGKAVANGGIAINDKWTAENGEKKERVCFIDFTLWGKGAEVFNQYTKKGSAVLLCGRLTFEQWDDAGTNRNKLFVTAETFQFLDRKEKSEKA